MKICFLLFWIHQPLLSNSFGATFRHICSSNTPNIQKDAFNFKELLEFERNGHIVSRGMLNPSDISVWRKEVWDAFKRKEVDAWLHSTRVVLGNDVMTDSFGLPAFETVHDCEQALKQNDAVLPFLQVFNSWRHNDAIASLVKDPRLGQAATSLLGVDRVRLYQDSIFLKRAGDGPTLWHSDLHMSPFDTNSMVTCWIPFSKVFSEENGGTGLSFASGSHHDFALPFWHRPHETGSDFSSRYEHCISDHGPLDLGDVTWHHGWTLHSAPANDGAREEDHETNIFPKFSRLALAVSYISDDVKIRSQSLCHGRAQVPINDEDTTSYAAWINDIPRGSPAHHQLLPLVWDNEKTQEDPSMNQWKKKRFTQ